MMILKLAILTSTMWQASVSTMEGRPLQGEISSVNSDSVVIQTDSESVTLPIDSVLSIQFESDSESDKPADLQQMSVVQLADGSLLSAEALTATADEVTLSNSTFTSVQFPRSSVRAIRLQPLAKEYELQWQSFKERQEEKDLLVIRKRDSDGLDFLAGNVAAVSAEEISFLLDGDEIPVPRERVFGIVFAEISNSNLKGSTTLRCQDGQQFLVQSLELVNSEFKIQTSWGQKFTLARARVAEVDYSTGRLHYLSDLVPITEEYNGLDPVGQEWGTLFDDDRRTRTGLSSQWKMSRDRFMNNGRPPLTLRSQTYAKGLCLFPSAKVEYALDKGYSRLKAVVGVDDDVAFQQPRTGQQTVVELQIEADGEVLFEQLIPAIADPIEIDLPLVGKNTLTILVDFGDDSSVCDYLDLANAVLIVQSPSNK